MPTKPKTAPDNDALLTTSTTKENVVAGPDPARTVLRHRQFYQPGDELLAGDYKLPQVEAQ